MERERAKEIIDFWFGDAERKERWFKPTPAFDEEIRRRFLGDYERAAAGELGAWQSSPDGSLALVLLLDQFARNLFRGSPRSYAADPIAVEAALAAIAGGQDQALPCEQRAFLYMPLMHSEDLEHQRRCLDLFDALGEEAPDQANYSRYARQHAEVVERFGRFPHRNEILGRASTSQEQDFLDGGGATFGVKKKR